MGILKKVNVFRRSLMRSVTKNIGKASLQNDIVLADKAAIKRILICRPNGRLGNLLLITPLIQEVTAIFPNCKVDLFVKGTLAPIIFENYESIDKVIDLPKKPFKNLLKYLNVWISIKRQNYDMAINVDQNSSSGRLAVQFSNAKYKFYGDSNEETLFVKKDYAHIAKYPVYNFRHYLTKLGFPKSNKIIPPLDLKLSSAEITEGRKVLYNLIKNEKRTICIFTFATGEKCLTEEWWDNFYTQLTTEYTNYNIIEILPVENVSQIRFKAPAFYSKDIREIGSVIANTDLFIGADSGIMHLSSAVQTPTIGLFSVSNLKKYGPYDNCSIGIDVNLYTNKDYLKTINSILNNGKLNIYSNAI
ncbi:glycosyltransferase family 9 protein [Flavobacterium sp. Root420]|uniref:glycosyltransferase family 9 protein n=1 Tax=Flavobacterium sp. Root420 TaxID=1736533 RepID=UPI0006F8A4E4|nr:glycosyltransferase family 9 protein [Flavobacterium sp. Root420]KQX12069.1 ADP-heptose--LPS heptosyltransferase [Flavobacterium sp. Root420]